MPYKCSETNLNEVGILNNLILSSVNLKDINDAKNEWGKYWKFILTDPKLLEFEKSSIENMKKRSLLAGIPSTEVLKNYQIEPQAFKKLIDNSELELNKKFFEKPSKFIPKLLDIKSEPKISSKSWLVMENLLPSKPPTVIAKLALHQVNFDKGVLEMEAENALMGNSCMVLSYGFREIVTSDPPEYL